MMKPCYKGTTILNESPLVAVIDDVLDAEQCRRFIELARSSMTPARVSLDTSAAVVEGRSGSNAWLGYDRHEEARLFGERISRLIGIPLQRAEAIQVVHYGPGQKYGAHYDAYDLTSERGKRCCKRGGQRLVTCLVYLNRADAGGSTSFPRLGIEVAAEPGRMLIFHNVEPGDFSRPHPDSLHGGDPVHSGEKWAMNIWFHEADMSEPFQFEPAPPAGSPRPWYSNRAERLFEAAFDGLPRAPAPTAPVLCYWDTYFGPEPGELQHTSRPVIRLVDRRLSNRLADKRRLPQMLRRAGLARLAPASFDSVQEALDALPDDELFFVKTTTGTAGQGVRCMDREQLRNHALDRYEIVQQAVSALRTHAGRKFTVRAYATLFRGRIHAHGDAIVIAHRLPYDPASADYAVQVDHAGYMQANSGITMTSTANLDWGEQFAVDFERFLADLAPVLEEVREACRDDRFSILGLDLLITDRGELQLIEINAHPNFVHTAEINQQVNIPMLRSLMQRAWPAEAAGS